MIKDNLYTGAEAREKLMAGIHKVAPAVAITLGTAGKNSLIECIESPGSYPTNDGYSIINSIRLADPLEDMGRQKLCEAINRANKYSGDGSSTTCVLTAAILEEGMKHLGEANSMDIKRSLEACIPLIESSLNAQKKNITVDTVAQVASISAEDEGIGGRIQEIYKTIGKEGIINWDISKTSDDSYLIGTGLTIHGATYLSRYMCDLNTNGFSTEVRLENIKVLLAKKKITSTTDFDGLFESLFNQDIKEILIFVEEIEPPIVNSLIQARQKLGFRAVVVKMPVLWADEWWEDLALASGATLIDSASGIKMRNLTIEHLGVFGNVIINREDTIIEGIKDISQHSMALKVEGTEKSLIRVGRLNTQTARYFVGAHSESALAYRRLKVEDAINAAACGLESGVVVGGGKALVNAANELPNKGVGAVILKKALLSPFNQIASNAGIKQYDISEIGLEEGFNSSTGNIENLVEKGIVDPTDVVINAVKNAIGVAASILTCETVITLPHVEQAALSLQSPLVMR